MAKKKKRMRRSARIILYVLIELLYFICNFVYFLFIRNQYSVTTVYSAHFFTAFILGALLIILLFGASVNRYVMLVYGEIFIIYLVTQSCYNRAFHSYYRFFTVQDLLGEVWGVKDSAAEFLRAGDIAAMALFAVMTIIFIILFFTFQKKAFALGYRLPVKVLSLLLLIPIVANYRAVMNKLEATKEEEGVAETQTDYYVYSRIPNVNQFVERFGILTFGIRDFKSFVSNETVTVDDRAMIAEFLEGRPEQTSNELTGIFEGKNVFFVQAESYNHICLDEELMPTIYKMYSESIRFDDFNTPALPGSTSDTEFLANTSLIPDSEGHAVCYTYPYNTFPTTLPNLFNDAGYHTTAYHNNYGEYYNRSVIMKTFGYDEYFDCTALGIGDTSDDTTTMNVMKWILAEEEGPWMAYWITYSGHQPYTLDSVGVSEEDVKKIREKYPDLSDEYVSYFAKNMDLDRCLGEFVQILEDAGKLDDVVFVFFGDHLVKSLSLYQESTIWEEMGREYTEEESYTDLYFYNSAAEPAVYKKVGTALDMIPTVANMWNFKIDMKTILGRDLADDTYRGFYFSEWDNWKTADWYYVLSKNYLQRYDQNYDLDTALEQISYYLKEKEVSRNILKTDYFAPEGKIYPSIDPDMEANQPAW
ncbi:MAG: LTA synthase family protein [Solobacterium sp.]|nr:LTA synthase family protein [Solobacterium sp.]